MYWANSFHKYILCGDISNNFLPVRETDIFFYSYNIMETWARQYIIKAIYNHNCSHLWTMDT